MSESSNNFDVPPGITLIHEGNETLVLERMDDIVSASLEPVRVMRINDGIAVTGIRAAAVYLGVHENTVRRYIDQGHLRAQRLPTGVRRIYVNSLKELYTQMFPPLVGLVVADVIEERVDQDYTVPHPANDINERLRNKQDNLESAFLGKYITAVKLPNADESAIVATIQDSLNGTEGLKEIIVPDSIICEGTCSNVDASKDQLVLTSLAGKISVQLTNSLTGEPQVDIDIQEKDESQEDNFTDLEIQILQLLSRRMKIKEIAAELHYASGTIAQYLYKNIYPKLGAHNRYEANRIAIKLGIV